MRACACLCVCTEGCDRSVARIVPPSCWRVALSYQIFCSNGCVGFYHVYTTVYFEVPTINAYETCFLALASFLSSFSPPLSRYHMFSLLRVASSVQHSSAPLPQVRVLLVSSVFCLISGFLLFSLCYNIYIYVRIHI